MGGFTLLEVLVALAVLAIAMAALVQAAASYTGNAAYLRDRTFAHWVAMNQVVEVQVAKDWPGIGSRTGSSLMGGHEWFWRRSVSGTDDPDLRRIEVDVYFDSASDSTLEHLVAFVGKPAAQ
jgi:general secretion pathway protein I